MAGPHDTVDDDDPDMAPCYRHPKELTALRCNQCDRPICVDCAVQGAVGIKCPDCARTPRAARGVVPVERLMRGIVVAAVVAGVLGGVLSIVRIPFIGIILAYAAGAAAGAAARRASGGYRDPVLAKAASAFAAVGMLALPLFEVLALGVDPSVLVWAAIYGAAAAYGAYTRAS